MFEKRTRKKRESGRPALALGRDDDPFDDLDLEPEDAPEPTEIIDAQDSFVESAKEELRMLFEREPDSVFYQKQLQVIFEGRYFHWITVRALTQLVRDRVLASEVQQLAATGSSLGIITFYRAIRNRYWKRDAEEIVKIVSRFSEPTFTASLGAHGETMFDAALPRAGFMPTGSKVRSYNGVEWTHSGHDLDRVFERDGVAYGTEIKNTLAYIDKDEMELKTAMCRHLGLRPLFIVRYAPKTYMYQVDQMGGFTLIFKYQLYPHGQKRFADEVRTRLRLPTDSPARIQEGTVRRLLDWHLKNIKKAR